MTIHEGPVGAEPLDLSSCRFAASLDPERRLPYRFLSCSFSLKHREGMQACALRLGRILLRLGRPLGHGSSLKGTLQESILWHLGAGFTPRPLGMCLERLRAKKEKHNVRQ